MKKSRIHLFAKIGILLFLFFGNSTKMIAGSVDCVIYPEDSTSVQSKEQPYESVVKKGVFIRGKAIGGFLLEDWWMANLCGGLEFRFKEYHGIGLDYVLMEHFNERDTFDYVNQYESSFGYTQYDLRQYLTLDYRLYDQMKPTKNGDFFAFYGAFFLRTGNRRIWNEVGWHYSLNDIHYAKYRYFDFGVAIGLHYAFGDSGFGFDTNFGGFARIREVHEEIIQSGPVMLINDGVEDIKVKPVFRFNLYYLFGSRKFRKKS